MTRPKNWKGAEEALKTVIRLGDKGEDLKNEVLDSPFHAYIYSKAALGKRWTEAEHKILGDFACLLYARDVVKGRWKEAESFISNDSVMSLIYATDVVRGRFEEGEEAIARSSFTLRKYAEFLGELPEKLHAAVVLLSFDRNDDWIREYFRKYDCRHG